MTREIPGPRGYPWLGSLPDFGRDMLGFFEKCAKSHGDVVTFKLAGHRALLFNRPELVEAVLLGQHRSFIKHRFFWKQVTGLFGTGILTNEGESWMKQRKLMQPAFHRERIEGYGRVMVESADTVVGEWRDGEIRDVQADMARLTLDIVVKTLFGCEMGAEMAVEIRHAFELALTTVNLRFRRALPIPEWIPVKSNRTYAAAVKRLDKIIYGFVRERRAQGYEGRNDLLSTLLAARDEAGGGMTDKQVRDELVTLFLAGHETTALTLTWTLWLLSNHPEKAAKLTEELNRVLHSNAPSAADVPKLAYLEATVTESMRLYPPAYAIGREASTDCEIGGIHVKTGTTIFLSPWLLHRDARYFERPLDFEPERWADGLAKRLPRFAYFPFGGGPRVCIGNAFAMMEAVLLLAVILQKYEFRPVPGQNIVPFPSITLRPKEPIRMKLTRRT